MTFLQCIESQPPGVRKGAWSREEDELLKKCIERYGEGKWSSVPRRAGLRRCRKSCRLRWLNYLSPDIHRGKFMEDEVDLIIRLHKLLGNRWSLIAGRLPGRTANDIKNFWNSHLSKKVGAQHERNHEPISKVQVVKPKPQRVVVTQTNWPICQENNNNNNEAGGSQINQDLIMHKSKQPVADEVINEEEQWLNDLTSTAQAENVMNTEQDFHFLYETEETLQEMVDEELFWGRIYELEKLL